MISDPFPLTIDYTLTLEQMIEAGHYDYVDPDITAVRFPVNDGTGITDAEAIIVSFTRRLSTDVALVELDRMGLRPADLAELLAFGANYPELQRQFPIVALGHVSSTRWVAFLCRFSFGRDLRLEGVQAVWLSGHRFLAFRKS